MVPVRCKLGSERGRSLFPFKNRIFETVSSFGLSWSRDFEVVAGSHGEKEGANEQFTTGFVQL
jgi:hypothetical protein